MISETSIPYLTYCLLNFDTNKVLYIHIQQFRKNFNKFLDRIINGEEITKEEIINDGLKLHWIPSKIRKNLLEENTNTFECVAEKKLEDLIKETKKILKEFNEKDPTKRDKKFKFSYKKGDLATFVARDIVRFMQVENEQKLSSFEYNLLQSKLASFKECYLKNLKKMYEELNLYKKHPFLENISFKGLVVEEIDERTGIEKYFERYITERKKWLNELREKPKTKEIFHFVDDFKTKKSKEEIIKYAKRLKGEEVVNQKNKKEIVKHPIYLPNDLFVDLLEGSKNKEKPNGISYLINKNVEKHKQQWFYDKSNFKNIDDKKQKYERDKKIRRAVMYDRIYWDMLSNKETKITDELRNIVRNHNLSAYNESREFLNKSIDMLQNYKFSGSKDTKDQPEIKPFKIDITGKRKLKDFGFFMHLMKDRKLPRILNYYAESEKKEVDNEVIEKQFDLFDEKKIEALKKVLLVDEQIFLYLDRNNIPWEDGSSSDGMFRKNFEKVPLKNDDDKKSREEIINVRNKLMHNQVPGLLSEQIQYDEEKPFSTKLFELIEKKCNEMLDTLKKLNSK